MSMPEEAVNTDYSSSIVEQVASSERLKIRSGKVLTVTWFTFVNLAYVYPLLWLPPEP